MATINKKLIHFRSLSDFETRLAAGDILDTSIVCIQDAKKIWTHGTYYDCNGGGDNVYIFNPSGVASEEYAGLQDAVNNGKMVAINMDGVTAPCILIPSESGIIVQVELAMSNTQESGASSYILSFSSMSYLVTEDGIALYNSGAVQLGGGDGTQVLTNSASYSSLKTINGESILGSGDMTIEGGSDIAVDSALSSTSENPVQNKIITSELAAIANNKQDTISDLATLRSGASAGATAVQPDDLATVATSGSYNDLSDKPTIPSGTITGVSANGTSVATSGVANIPAATTSRYGVTKLSSSTSSTSTTLAATASAVKAAYDLANSKQATLVSGTNIKTVNGQSLLGSGDITIEGGSGSYVAMNNTWYDSPSSVTIAPNSSVEIVDLGLTSIDINLTEPTDNSVVNTYTLVIRKFGMGNAFTFDKTIYWANDNAPVFDTTASDEFVEISIKRIFEGYYLGTWAKFSMS